ncbi:MAG: hypothetical protein GTO14_11825 [Anaerolineales bacterium]|nr:hypothetical protein [Anaerolineales bacterium]
MRSLRVGKILFIVLMALIVGACGRSGSIGREVLEPTTKPAEPQVSVEEPEPQAAVPTPRTELAATDPSAVSLPSGKLTLVEFFAYW